MEKSTFMQFKSSNFRLNDSTFQLVTQASFTRSNHSSAMNQESLVHACRSGHRFCGRKKILNKQPTPVRLAR